MFDTREVESFARELAADLAARFPSEEETTHRKNTPQKLSRALEDLYGRAVQFHRQRDLGIYKKAKLGNTLRWELKNRGYSEAFIDSLVRELVVRLAAKPR